MNSTSVREAAPSQPKSESQQVLSLPPSGGLPGTHRITTAPEKVQKIQNGYSPQMLMKSKN